MSIINIASGGEPIPEYGWIEYGVSTNSWTTTEWQAVSTPLPAGTPTTDSHRDDVVGMQVSPTYTIDQNTGNIYPSTDKSFYTTEDNSSGSHYVGAWYRFSDKIILYLDHYEFTYESTSHSSGNTFWHFNVHFTKALTTQQITTPHTSTTVNRNSIVGIHLTEQTGQQFDRYPIIG